MDFWTCSDDEWRALIAKFLICSDSCLAKASSYPVAKAASACALLSFHIRSAKACEVSWNTVSFKVTSACSGVLVLELRPSRLLSSLKWNGSSS